MTSSTCPARATPAYPCLAVVFAVVVALVHCTYGYFCIRRSGGRGRRRPRRCEPRSWPGRPDVPLTFALWGLGSRDPRDGCDGAAQAAAAGPAATGTGRGRGSRRGRRGGAALGATVDPVADVRRIPGVGPV